MSSTTITSDLSSKICIENNNGSSNKTELINDSSNKTELSNDNRDTRDIDGGWAWIVLFCNVIAAILAAGQFFNNGLYFYIFLNTFGQSRSTTMWITASQSAANGLAGIISSKIIMKHGNRKTMFIGSIIMGTSYAMMFFANSVPYAIVCFTIAGVGSALILVTYITSLGLYFNKKLGIATGIVLAGSGIGTTIIGLEIEWAVATFGWRGSMLIQSGLIFQICICAATIYNKVPSTKQTSSNKIRQTCSESENVNTSDIANSKKLKESETSTTTSSFLFDVRFWILQIGFTFYFAGVGTVLQIIKDFVASNNFSFQYGSVIICNGVANCIGRVCGGFSASYIEPILFTSYVATLCGLAICMLLFSSIEAVVLIAIVFFGFTNGLQGAPHAMSCVLLFGEDRMASVYSYSFVTGVLPTLIMSPLAGYIVDQTGTFLPVIILASVCMLLCGMSFLLIHIIHKRKLGIYTFDHNLNITTTNVSISSL